MRKLIPTLMFAVLSASQLGATDCGQALRDPGFDLWCGSSLCAWKLERGAIKKVATWNQGDPGVELDGSDVAIEQLSPVTSRDGNCIEFDLIANVDANAEVDLDIDVFGDGSVDHVERVVGTRWKQVSFLLPIHGTYGGIRFEIAKRGNGRAQIAQIEARTAQGCSGLTPIVPAPAPVGATCTDGSTCQSGMCSAEQCVGCDPANPAATCSAGQTCGFGDATSPVYTMPVECVPAGAQLLAQNCLVDAQCASGTCTNFMCSTCRNDGASTGCVAGETCGPAWARDPVANPFGITPYVCDPNAHRRTSGEPCASDDDCASAACDGTSRDQCPDGRACASAANCPFDSLKNEPCSTVGVQGGSCR
jgi:hypothetical protein